jgi:hypothetical protein
MQTKMMVRTPVQLERQLILTDVGALWLAQRGPSSKCLILLADRGIASQEFRAALDRLKGEVDRIRPPRVLQIAMHEWLGDHYYVEYSLDGDVRTLPEYFADTNVHWMRRLKLVQDIADLYERWKECMAPPLELHAGRVVVCNVAGRWLSHYAPCPKIALESPYDLAGADVSVLAAVAPEKLRGKAEPGLLEDVYAMGVLTLLALGHAPSLVGSEGAKIEAQARSPLSGCNPEELAIESALKEIEPVRERVSILESTACRCVDFSPGARPKGLSELKDALSGILAIESAGNFVEENLGDSPADALRLLQWAFSLGQDNPELRLRAADLCRDLRMSDLELLHLNRLLGMTPGDYILSRRRMALRCAKYLVQAAPIDINSDPEGDWLLAEIDRLRPQSGATMGNEEKAAVKEDRLRSAMIHGRRGDSFMQARELYEITALDFQDVDALYLYGLSLKEMASQNSMTDEHRSRIAESIERLVKEARFRTGRLGEAGILETEEVRAWEERFQCLRLS